MYEYLQDREKKADALKATCKQVRNHIKTEDWARVKTEFDTLNEQKEKGR
jgi:hypothetical protein